jgi:putative endonuclease
MTVTARTSFGQRGERYARTRLERLGWRFIAANWHCRAGELDLVMREDDALIFVEVKTRRGDGAGYAEESISPTKARRLLSAAEWFIADHPDLGDLIWRIDLIAITVNDQNRVERWTHIHNAVVTG